MSLSGLGDDDVAAFLEATIQHSLGRRGRALVAILQRETEGNPFFIESILLHLVETNASTTPCRSTDTTAPASPGSTAWPPTAGAPPRPERRDPLAAAADGGQVGQVLGVEVHRRRPV